MEAFGVFLVAHAACSVWFLRSHTHASWRWKEGSRKALSVTDGAGRLLKRGAGKRLFKVCPQSETQWSLGHLRDTMQRIPGRRNPSFALTRLRGALRGGAGYKMRAMVLWASYPKGVMWLGGGLLQLPRTPRTDPNIASSVQPRETDTRSLRAHVVSSGAFCPRSSCF